MPVFEYTALDEKGKTKTGIIDAESVSAARQKIRGLASFPVSIKEIYEAGNKKHPQRSFSFSRYFTRIKATDTAMMTRQLATLLSAGLPLVTTIDTLIPQTKAHAMKAMMARIKDSIVEGNSFANALGMYPAVFSSLYINMVRAGESSGTLEIVLERLADITENQQALKQRIQSAMAYPILMSIIGVSVLLFLLTNVVPQITTIFEDFGKALPLPTIILIHSSKFVQSWWWVFLMAAGGMFFSLRQIKKTVKGKYYWDRFRLKFPLFGNIARKLAISRFSRTLGSLLDNGVSLLTALDIVKNISDNSLIILAVEKASEYVSKGQSLAVSLGESDIFPNLPIQMIRVGEQSGELESMLDKVADIFEREVESNILSLTALMEPIMILVMALIVGFIVLSICLPIFEMSQLIG